MRWLLGLLAAVTATAGVTAGAVFVLDLDQDDDVSATTETEPTPALRPDQGLVEGTLTTLVAEGAVIDPLPTPLTVTTPERGFGAGGTFAGAVVEGAPSEIVWDAGRPLELSGEGGALLPGPVKVEAHPEGILVVLDGPVHGFAPATYRIDTPVAVGADGLGRPVPAVTFDATATTTVVFAGGATVALGPAPIVLRGPGRFTLQGTFQLTTAAGTRTATSLSFGTGAFELVLTPAAGGFGFTATIQGPHQAT